MRPLHGITNLQVGQSVEGPERLQFMITRQCSISDNIQPRTLEKLLKASRMILVTTVNIYFLETQLYTDSALH